MNEKSRDTCNIGNTTLKEDIQSKNKALNIFYRTNIILDLKAEKVSVHVCVL
jgi:hypothetical protein